MVDLEPLREPEDVELRPRPVDPARRLHRQHRRRQRIARATGTGPSRSSSRSCRVDYRRVLEERKRSSRTRQERFGQASASADSARAVSGGDALVGYRRPDFHRQIVPRWRYWPTRSPAASRERLDHDLPRGLQPVPRREAARPGRALHGLRHPVLPPGLPARQPDPRLERPGLPRPVADGDRPPPRHEQLPRVHRQALPRALRGVVRAGDQQRPGDDQADRGQRSSTAPGTKAGSCPQPPEGQDGQEGRRRRLRPRRASPPPSSSPAPGTTVTVFERADRIGGLLRYGIPDFKMEKWRLDRRLAQMEAEGVVFRPGVNVGVDITADAILDRVRRRLPLRRRRPSRATCRSPGASSKGIHFAMEYLPLQNKRGAGDDDRRRRVHHAPRAST